MASKIYRYTRKLGYLVPMKSTFSCHAEKFEGATVIEPTRGFYLDPVATLDFSSLYPSIMVAHNLCYSTLVPQNMLKKWRKRKYKIYETPNGEFFIETQEKKGILPRILEDLVQARQRVRKEMADCKDPFELMILDAR